MLLSKNIIIFNLFLTNSVPGFHESALFLFQYML